MFMPLLDAKMTMDREREIHNKQMNAMYAANKAHNEGLWDSIPWHRKHVYFLLKKPEDPADI